VNRTGPEIRVPPAAGFNFKVGAAGPAQPSVREFVNSNYSCDAMIMKEIVVAIYMGLVAQLVARMLSNRSIA
jgi:hypothetical protein